VEVLKPLSAAVIVAVPALTPIALPEAEIVAIVVSEEVHTTELVRFLVLPSVNIPEELNCSASPTVIEVFRGVTASD
jgi:hypothetical protein